jgi:hypothetical protein
VKINYGAVDNSNQLFIFFVNGSEKCKQTKAYIFIITLSMKGLTYSSFEMRPFSEKSTFGQGPHVNACLLHNVSNTLLLLILGVLFENIAEDMIHPLYQERTYKIV